METRPVRRNAADSSGRPARPVRTDTAGRRVAAHREPAPELPDVPLFAVARRRLISLLDIAAHQQLTIVVAPPGYGKTVLLAQWARAHPAQRVRWFTLAPEDNDAPTFARRLRAALDPRGGRSEEDGGNGPDVVPSSVGALVAELDRMPPTTLILDDFHELSNPALLDDVATLVEHAPLSLRVVIATQIDPPAPYYRLSLSDALVELRQQDLAFTDDEAVELVEHLTGLSLDAGRIDKLVQRTEGWAVGLQLAALSLREAPDIDAFVERFAGNDRHVADYLTEHVLSRQEDTVRDFLLSTSVLERLNGALCEAVTGRADAEEMLEELQRRSIFITTLDTGCQWFRYHPLFRTLLRQHLRDRSRARERRLLRAAADWHLGRGDVDAGVHYLAEARAWPEVLDAASAYGGEMLASGHASAVAGWIRRVPADIREKSTAVMLLEAAATALAGDGDRADGILDTIGESAAPSAGERQVALLLRAYAALQQGRMADAAAAADATLDAAARDGAVDLPDVLGLTSSPSDVITAARVIRGVALVYQGDLGAARESLDPIPESSHVMWQIAALGSLALLEAWSGRLRTAQWLGTRALTLVHEVADGQDSLRLDASLALAGVARERGDLSRARALLQDARWGALRERGRIGDTLVAIEQALVALAEGQPAAGLTVLNGHRAASHRPLPDAVAARQRAAEAQLLIMAGERESAARTLDLAPRETSEVVAARVLLAVETGDVRGAQDLIGRWPPDPEPRANLERRLWLSVTQNLEGDEQAAEETMAAVVADAALEENIGLFRSHHLIAPARALYRRDPTPFLRAVTDRPPASPVRRAKETVDQLTEREYMLLPLLPTRLSNAEIADTLGVSLNTVKTHLKHIYRKLGVTERSEAIAAAERLHLW